MAPRLSCNPFCCQLRRGSDTAFTVPELLVVVALTAVLALFLFVGVGAIRAASDRTKCAANLQRLGQIGLLYAAEHNNNLLPLRRDLEGDPAGFWYDHLHQYVGRERGRAGRYVKGVLSWHPQFKCPLKDEQYAINFICGWNDGLRAAPKWYLKMGQGFVDGSAVDLRGGVSKTAWFSDAMPGGEYFLPEYYKQTVSRFLGFPHANTCNVVFMDGHMENIPNPDFKANPNLIKEARWKDFFGK